MSIGHEARTSRENLILAALPPDDYERLASHLQKVDLPQGKMLYVGDGTIDYIYFPTGAMISLVSRLPDGASAEVGLTGFEGATGISAMLGVDKSPHECVVQLPNGAVRAPVEVVKREFARAGTLQAALLRFTQSLLFQVSQVAACNRLHTVEERLARWLSMCNDRYEGDQLPLTHEFLSQMLGARRAGVTTAAVALQAEGYISYTRGRIAVVDREGLENFACNCYPLLKAEFDSLPRRTQTQR